ncbi:hypothetical protein JW711_01025 [Candidatus Woesearchaeota archaeon]|nr:hypothetical protein [Candidatus Woesearchaeota archaeon]
MIYLIEIYRFGGSMDFTYNGKPVFATKTAATELGRIGIDLIDVPKILHSGFDIRKRKKGTLEKCISRGNKVINVVVVDTGTHYKLIHAGEFTMSNKFKEMKREKDGF